jgi:alkanesulfonate monooxygenase SsuD/methylene tetrahydromethanopterin reductase-like flavin-dependent oxidoreductase (luciferase family)
MLMADYGRPLSFGYFLIPNAVEYPRLVELAHLVDNLGLEFIGIQDHPYQRRFLDTWTLLTAIAVQTKRVRLFPDVANLPLRPPAILAKAAASLDLISGGRVELGLGAGAFWEAIAALGGPTRKPRESLTAMEEAIHVIRLMWSDQRSVRFDGQFYSLHGVHPGPAPKHPIGIWLGAYGPKMLALTGRLADGWVPSLSYAPPVQLSEQNRLIDEAAASAGRDPAAIRRVCNINGRITNGPTTSFLDGPVEHWVDELTKLSIEEGMDSYILWPAEADESQLQRFAQEVVPQVRERVEQHRRVI